MAKLAAVLSRLTPAGLILSCSALQPGTPPGFEPDQAWADSTRTRIAARLEANWGQALVRQPRVELVPSRLRESVIDSFALPPRHALRPSTTLLATLHLAPGAEASASLGQASTRALYLVRSGRLLLFPDGDSLALVQEMAHELTHALQAQRSDLPSLLGRTGGDERLGLLGALEGQARLMATLAPASTPTTGCGVSPSALWELAEALRLAPATAGLPSSVSLPAFAPYVLGRNLACEALRRHGRSGWDSLLRRPPSGSWQLATPSLWSAGARPADWDSAWGTLALPRRWSPFEQARIGELLLASLLLDGDRDLAWQRIGGSGTLGWEGDRVWCFRDAKGALAYGWRLRFRSAFDASEFAQAWWQLAGLRQGRPLLPPTRRGSDLVALATTTSGTGLGLQLSGRDLAFTEGFPEGQAASLLGRLLRKRQVSGAAD